jgi:hypothetical protein
MIKTFNECSAEDSTMYDFHNMFFIAQILLDNHYIYMTSYTESVSCVKSIVMFCFITRGSIAETLVFGDKNR